MVHSRVQINHLSTHKNHPQSSVNKGGIRIKANKYNVIQIVYSVISKSNLRGKIDFNNKL